ncbi:hypothetical protein AB0M46_50805 [Dactylosporangium sp. NPDC051485]|uniref:hypothetical protein n=1 Tax=Dactylosporangium sp. NPDC051485 TaxID=3154846 RepID=UPI00343E6214
MDELWQSARDRVDAGDLDGLAGLLAGAGATDRAALLPLLEEHRPPVAQAEPVELPPLEPEPEPELPTGSFAVAIITHGDEPPKIPRTTEELRAHFAAERLRERERARASQLYHLRQEAAHAATRRNIARQAAHAFAVLACTAKAPDAVRAFLRRWPDAVHPPAEAAAPLLRVRGAAWCTTLARGLARRARSAANPWAFTEALLRVVGEPLPQDPAAVAEYVSAWRGAPLADVLAGDPWFDAALPYVFDDDRVGAAFVTRHAGRDWPPALLELAASGRVPRATLIAGCLRRLRTGGRTGLLQPYLRLLTSLEPAPAELAAHRAELLGLLGAPLSTIAGFAHAGLLAVHAATPLDGPEIGALTVALFTRPEKKLVRAHLAWLRGLPLDGLLPDLADGLAAGLHHPDAELAGKVLDLAAPRLDGLRGRLQQEVPLLEGEIGERLAALLGTAPAEPAAPPVLVADLPAGMPAPLDLDGLVTELAVHQRTAGRTADPVQEELLLDGLVRAARGDRDATAKALAPVVPRWDGWWPDVVRAATGRPVAARRPGDAQAAPLTRFWLWRLAELARRLAAAPPPALLATPATAGGLVDPARVLALLTAAERDGWAPDPADLTQALLRLPLDAAGEIGAGAARLASPAGRELARWLAEAPRTPRTWVEDVPELRYSPAQRIAMLDPAGLPAGITDPRGAAERVNRAWPPADLPLWPMMTPSRPEIAATHIQPFAVSCLDGNNFGTATLAGLAALDGPDGPAMALLLAYTLGNHRSQVRLAAADLLLARGRGRARRSTPATGRSARR